MKQITIDPREFEAFCRTKPADEEYEVCDSSICAVAQFLRTKDPSVKPAWGSGNTWAYIGARGRYDFSNEAVGDRTLLPSPNTFGALADRLAGFVEVAS
jgi:hypothetical protein